MVAQSHKRELMSHLIKHHDWKQVLVFTRTKHGANRLAETLIKNDIQAAAIHGNKSQGARTKALAQFTDGSMRVLVATDIAARGLDIDQLPQVVNFELPNVPEDYVHRIGRTGRAGSSGAAVSLVDREELKLLKDIEKLIKREIPKVQVEGFTPNANPEPEPPRSTQPHGRPPRGHSRNSQSTNSISANSTGANSQGTNSHNANPQGNGQNAGRNTKPNGQRQSQPSRNQDGNPGRNQGTANVEGRPTRSHNPNAPRPNNQQPRNGNVNSQKPAHSANNKNLSEAARHQAMPQPALFAPPPSPSRHQPNRQNTSRPANSFGNPSRNGGRGR
jgi:ATP-dependent RNA helicase RhlE